MIKIEIEIETDVDDKKLLARDLCIIIANDVNQLMMDNALQKYEIASSVNDEVSTVLKVEMNEPLTKKPL